MIERARIAFFTAATSVVAASACLVSIDDGKVGGESTGGDAAPTDGARVDGGATDGGNTSGDGSGRCATGMLAVPDETTRLFCMDKTEVTVGQYAAFINDAGSPEVLRLPLECKWKGSLTFVPDNWNPSGDKTLPVTGVDWCDAWAFCTSAGKRLCRAIGGGAVEFTEGYADASASEWMHACSHAGAHDYPYPGAYDPTACVGVDYVPKPTAPLPVAQAARCTGGYAGLVDMSGNVSEWEDSCSTAHLALCDAGGPECDFCHNRGGGVFSNVFEMKCKSGDNGPRRLRLDDLGFRCCAD